jgi:peptidyl-Lys metalloendopeptidase
MSQSAAEHIDKTLSYLESTIGLTYTAWFGRFNPERFSNVSNVFRNLHGVNLPMLTYDCSCKMQAQFAWVTPTEFGVIKICPVFWTATTDMQKIVLIMMASEWTDVGDTHEYAWTALDCQILAQENPEKAVGNAATYGFFALLA